MKGARFELYTEGKGEWKIEAATKNSSRGEDWLTVKTNRSSRLVNKYEYLEPAAIPDFGVRGYIFK